MLYKKTLLHMDFVFLQTLMLLNYLRRKQKKQKNVYIQLFFNHIAYLILVYLPMCLLPQVPVDVQPAVELGCCSNTEGDEQQAPQHQACGHRETRTTWSGQDVVWPLINRMLATRRENYNIFLLK